MDSGGDDAEALLAAVAAWAVDGDGRPLPRARALLAVLWSRCTLAGIDAVLGPLVAACVAIEPHPDDPLVADRTWLAHTLHALRPGAEHDIAQDGAHALHTPHYDAFVTALAQAAGKADPRVLGDAFVLYAAAAIDDAGRADVTATTGVTGAAARHVGAAQAAATRNAAAYLADLGAMLAATHPPPPPSPPPVATVATKTAATPAAAAAAAAATPMHCGVRMLDAFRARARMHFADDAQVWATFLVAALAPREHIGELLRRVAPGLSGDAGAYADRVRARLPLMRDEWARDATPDTWLGLAHLLAQAAAVDAAPGDVSAGLAAFCVGAERAPGSMHAWNARQALAAYVLCQHSVPDHVWHAAFELGLIKRGFRQAIARERMTRPWPEVPADVLGAVVAMLARPG